MAVLNFDPSKLEPREEIGAIPTDEYIVMITDSGMKDTSTPGGQYLELAHTVLDGPFKGRKVWARLNIINPSADTVKYAQYDLEKIAKAVGHVGVLQDSQQLHNKPHLIRVNFIPAGTPITKGKKAGTQTERDNNEIKDWKAIAGTLAAAPTNAAGSSPFAGPGASADGKPHWAGNQAA